MLFEHAHEGCEVPIAHLVAHDLRGGFRLAEEKFAGSLYAQVADIIQEVRAHVLLEHAGKIGRRYAASSTSVLLRFSLPCGTPRWRQAPQCSALVRSRCIGLHTRHADCTAPRSSLQGRTVASRHLRAKLTLHGKQKGQRQH